jgi:hypothetical protein
VIDPKVLALASRTTQAFAEAFKLLNELWLTEPALAVPMVVLLKQFAANAPDAEPLVSLEGHN